MLQTNLQSGSVHARVTFRGDTMDLLSGNPFPDNNVSSIEKLGTGIYRINYSNSMFAETGTASSGNSTTLTDATKVWPVDAWSGSYITITAGTGSGQTKIIVSNTSTTITVIDPWGPAPDATSQYRILGVNHTVAANCQLSNATASPGCVELVSTIDDSATIATKLAGENYSSVTYFDPGVVDFIASSNYNGQVNLSVNTIKAWACIKDGVLADGSNIESVRKETDGAFTVNFARGFADYTIIASSSNCINSQATASITYQGRGANSVRLYPYGFGESVNSRTDVVFTPVYLNLIVFGNLNDFEVTLDTASVSGSCNFTLPNGCRAITGPVTVTTLGGTAPFTYQWKYVNGDTGFQIASPTKNVTVFSKTGIVDAESARFQVEVTDSLGKKACSGLVEAQISRISQLPGSFPV